jgi:hypothetical protein
MNVLSDVVGYMCCSLGGGGVDTVQRRTPVISLNPLATVAAAAAFSQAAMITSGGRARQLLLATSLTLSDNPRLMS